MKASWNVAGGLSHRLYQDGIILCLRIAKQIDKIDISNVVLISKNNIFLLAKFMSLLINKKQTDYNKNLANFYYSNLKQVTGVAQS